MFTRSELLPGEDFYTKIPQHWIRDHRLPALSFRVLCFWVSHEVGYRVTMEQTIAETKEGRDAIYTAIRELLELKYIRRSQARRADGKHGQIDYELGEAAYEQDYIRNWGRVGPSETAGQSSNGPRPRKPAGQTASWETGSGGGKPKIPAQAASWETVSGSAVNGSTGYGQHDTKKNNLLEDQGLEKQSSETPPTPRAPLNGTAPSTEAEREGGDQISETEVQELINELKQLMSRKLNGQRWKWLDQRTRAALVHMKDDHHPFPVIRLALLSLARDVYGPTASPMRVVEAGPWWDKAYAEYRTTTVGYSPSSRSPAARCSDCDERGWRLEPDRGTGTRRLPVEPAVKCTHKAMAGVT